MFRMSQILIFWSWYSQPQDRNKSAPVVRTLQREDSYANVRQNSVPSPTEVCSTRFAQSLKKNLGNVVSLEKPLKMLSALKGPWKWWLPWKSLKALKFYYHECIPHFNSAFVRYKELNIGLNPTGIWPQCPKMFAENNFSSNCLKSVRQEG